MNNSERQIKEDIIKTAIRLHHKNMLAACDGNISYRVDDNTILITPSGVPKFLLQENDIALIDINGKVITGEPSSEMLMHLEVYRMRAEAKAVIHAHPPTAVAYSIAYPDAEEIPGKSFSELILAVGKLPIVPFQMPGSLEMGTALHPYIKNSKVMVLARHGAISFGEDLVEAYNGMERLEHSCEILLKAKSFGAVTELDDQTIDRLYAMRKKIGDKTL
ncbi:MAG: class II aldolase/adducin family protein [Gammaproteobacteria bacterium]|nr:class II aldolase/adducin family protein [Gammaproteobacteria bacterium]